MQTNKPGSIEELPIEDKAMLGLDRQDTKRNFALINSVNAVLLLNNNDGGENYGKSSKV